MLTIHKQWTLLITPGKDINMDNIFTKHTWSWPDFVWSNGVVRLDAERDKYQQMTVYFCRNLNGTTQDQMHKHFTIESITASNYFIISK